MGVAGIERDVNPAGVLVLVNNLLPVLAAVGRAEDATLGVRPKRMTQGSDKDDIGILGVNDPLADGSGIGQTCVLPGLAAIRRLVNAVAMRNVSPDAGLARPHIND